MPDNTQTLILDYPDSLMLSDRTTIRPRVAISVGRSPLLLQRDAYKMLCESQARTIARLTYAVSFLSAAVAALITALAIIL